MINISPPVVDVVIDKYEMKEKSRLIKGISGVYVLKDKKGFILYVGKSKNLYKRTQSHLKGEGTAVEYSHLIKSLECYYINDKFERGIIEVYFIKKLSPTFNRDRYDCASVDVVSSRDREVYEHQNNIETLSECLNDLKYELKEIEEDKDSYYDLHDETYVFGEKLRLYREITETEDKIALLKRRSYRKT